MSAAYRLVHAVIELDNGRHVRIEEDRSFRGVLPSDGFTWDGALYGPPWPTPDAVTTALNDLFPPNREEASA